jgi:hypothetical protein
MSGDEHKNWICPFSATLANSGLKYLGLESKISTHEMWPKIIAVSKTKPRRTLKRQPNAIITMGSLVEIIRNQMFQKRTYRSENKT